MEDNTELVLHVWPARWDLPTFTPTCLASVLYLQLNLPGKFVLEETTDPDLSPDGQLPYLTHRTISIASYPSIVEYVDGLSKQNSSSDQQQAQEIAWIAYVSAHLGDLVACSFFTLRHNYFECVRPSLSELFPIPLRYYVPDRLREMYKPRLEAAGLWTVHTEEAEEEKRKKKGFLGLTSITAVEEAFGKEKVLEKGRTVFDLLARLLGDKPFFLNNQELTALDALVAAHIILLTMPPLPNDLLRILVTESYPSLLTHARKLFARTISRQSSHGRSASLSSSYNLVESEAQVTEHVVPLQIRSVPSARIPGLVTSLLVPVSWRPTASIIEVKDKLGEDEELGWTHCVWFGAGVLGIIGWALFRSSKFIHQEL